MASPRTSDKRDPKGYYAALDIAPDADADAIKAAYRKKAMDLHPDRTGSDEMAAFQLVNEAYATLRDAAKRADYDAQAATAGGGAPPPPSNDWPLAPLTCCACNKVTAQPRFVIYDQITGLLIKSRQAVRQGIYCRDCADKAGIWASLGTLLLGWWSPLGPIHSARALLRNMRGGTLPKVENLHVLMHQARAFLSRGDTDVARALAENARAFAPDVEQLRQVDGFIRSLDSGGRRLKNRWLGWSRGQAVQAAMTALPLIALLAWGGLTLMPQKIPADQRPVQGELGHVAADALKVRLQPSNGAPVVALLERFATVQVLEVSPDGDWVRLATPSGTRGFAPTVFLRDGPGLVPKNRWCEEERGGPPRNGEVLSRRSSGEHALAVRNDSGTDALVRLKNAAGRTQATFFVATGQEAVVPGLPEGTYRAVFASGADYSRACGVFMKDQKAFEAPEPVAVTGTARPLLVLPATSKPLAPEDFIDN